MAVKQTLQQVLNLLDDSQVKLMRGESIARMVERVDWQEPDLTKEVIAMLRNVPMGGGSEVTEQFIISLLTREAVKINTKRMEVAMC